jgi:hypothetical protein
MVFSIIMENTKVVANFLILLFLKFHDSRPYGLGVIKFRSLQSGFAYALNRSECLVCLTYVHMESCLGDSRRSVLLLVF